MSSKEYTAIDLARASVAPRTYQCMPPSTSTLSSFSKRFDVTGNFTVNDSALVIENVPTSSGAVIWFPWHGTQGIYRFGIVPGGALNTSPGFVLLQGFGGTSAFHWYSPTAVPYSSHVSSDPVMLSPNLTGLKTTSAPDYLLFSSARVTSGDLFLRCETIPIGSTALNGYFSAAAINDWRDVMQVGFVDFTVSGTTLDPSQLVQAAVTQKDGVKETSGMDGVRAVLGPDIPQFYGPPNADSVDNPIAGTVLQVPVVITPYSFPLGGQTSLLRMLLWYSPWNTGLTDASDFCVRQNVNYGPIDPFSVLDCRFTATLVPNGTAQPAGYYEEWLVRVDHVFATCSSNGQVLYTTATGQTDLTTIGENGINYAYFDQDIPTAALYRGQFAGPYPAPQPPQCSGIYLGTQLALFVQNESGVGGTQPPAVVTNPQIYLRPRNLYQPGSLGPIRVLKYDAFSNGQNLRLDGQFFAECIPGGTTAPFTQLAAQTSEVCMNLSSLPFLTELYNCEGPFQRVWSNKDYLDFVRNALLRFGPSTLQHYGSHRLMIAAQNAGLLDDEEDYAANKRGRTYY